MSATNDHVAAFRKLMAANLADGWPVDWPAACCELVDAAEKAVNGLCQRLAVDWLPAGSVPQTAGSYLFTEHGKVWAVHVQDEDFEFNRFETDRMKSVRWASWEPPALPPLDARPTA